MASYWPMSLCKNLVAALVAALFLLAGTGPARPADAEPRAVEFAMKNVMYHYSEAIAAHIFHLEGELRPTKPEAIVVFDDANSFVLAVSSAEISISCSSLAQVLNQNVFSSAQAPIHNVSIVSANGRLTIKGKFHLKGDVPFETTGTLSPDPDGRIRLHADHVKAAHLPVKGLLDLLGIDLAKLIDTNKVRGVAVEKDDILLDPEQILPPPRLQGKVTAVRLQGNDIVLNFGGPPAPRIATRQQGNYMAFHHGEMRFGKLTMHDADLIMIDMDPRDPFNFFLQHYQEQLVAGYTKSTPQYGLRTYTKDYDKLPSHRSRPSSRPQ